MKSCNCTSTGICRECLNNMFSAPDWSIFNTYPYSWQEGVKVGYYDPEKYDLVEKKDYKINSLKFRMNDLKLEVRELKEDLTKLRGDYERIIKGKEEFIKTKNNIISTLEQELQELESKKKE